MVNTELKPETAPLTNLQRTFKIEGVTAEEAAIVEPVMEVRNLNVWYGHFQALRDVTVPIARQRITAIIGPSGCGKSTLIRCLNRMNDLIPVFRAEGEVLYEGENLYDSNVDAVEVRRRIGMVFQKPNPFPKSIYDNVAFGPRINGFTGKLDDIVEHAIHQAALWDDVKDKLHQRPGAVGRPAAAPVHCEGPGHRTRRDPDG